MLLFLFFAMYAIREKKKVMQYVIKINAMAFMANRNDDAA